MKKILLGTLLLVTMLSAKTVKADELKTIEEANAAIEKLNLIDNKDGTYTYYADSIDFDIIADNSCNYNIDEFLTRFPWQKDLSKEEQQQNYESNIEVCKMYPEMGYFNNLSRKYYNENYIYNIEQTDDIYKLTIYTEEEQVTRNLKIIFKEVDKNILNKANKVRKQFKYNYMLYGLNALNSLYHYGGVDVNLKNPSVLLYRFPELKQVMMDNSEFEYQITYDGAGGTEYLFGCGGPMNIVYNGIMYATNYSLFEFNHFLPVDKDAEGTVYEKAQKRIDEFFKDRVNATVITDYSIAEDIDRAANEAFKTTDVKYTGYIAEVDFSGRKYRIIIVEVDKAKVDSYEVYATDKNSGVNVKTDSFEVPSDAILSVSDVKNKHHVIKALGNQYKIEKAFDINLLKSYNSEKITEIENGVEVYIPLSNKKLGDTVYIHHVNDDGTPGELIEGKVIVHEGKYYAKFLTDHFSTYAIVEELTNPNTNSLNIILAIIAFIISFLILCKTFKETIWQK